MIHMGIDRSLQLRAEEPLDSQQPRELAGRGQGGFSLQVVDEGGPWP